MIHSYKIEGGPGQGGYSKRCPHSLYDTEPVQLSTTRQRYRYGPDRPTIQRPLFVGPGCASCLYNVARCRSVLAPPGSVLCSFPVRAWDLPAEAVAPFKR